MKISVKNYYQSKKNFLKKKKKKKKNKSLITPSNTSVPWLMM